MAKDDWDIGQVGKSDQAHKGTEDLARMTLAFWKELVAGGLTEEHATRLTAVYLAGMWKIAQGANA